MKRYTAFALAALSRHISIGSAQHLKWATAVVTECIDPEETTAAPEPTEHLPYGTVTYNMPACPDCDCPTCVVTSVYTTTLQAFCPSGLTDHPYTVTETYSGMSSIPTFATLTPVPYGFTVQEATCTICGEAPITATLTYPSGSTPYAVPVNPAPQPENAGLAKSSGTQSAGASVSPSVISFNNATGTVVPVPVETTHPAAITKQSTDASQASATKAASPKVVTAGASSAAASSMFTIMVAVLLASIVA